MTTPAVGLVATQGGTVVTTLSSIGNFITGLFKGCPDCDGTNAIAGWLQSIEADPSSAAALNLNTAAGQAWVHLRCWAGDQSIVAQYVQVTGDRAALGPQGCGCATTHGCRANAIAAVGAVRAQFPQLTTGTLNSGTTSPATTSSSPQVVVGLTGVSTVGGTTTVAGISIWVWFALAAVAIFVLVRRK